MRLNAEQRAMLAGEFGPARQWAIRHQMEVGAFFDAPDLVPVGQAHIMADTEATGTSGVVFIEQLASLPEAERKVRVPTITDEDGRNCACCGSDCLQAYRAVGDNHVRHQADQLHSLSLCTFGSPAILPNFYRDVSAIMPSEFFKDVPSFC